MNSLSNDPDCVICRLLARELEVSLIYEEELCTAFMDIQPINPGHLLVVSNRHAANLTELSPEEGAQIFRVGQHLAEALRRSGVKCEGVNFFLADGKAAGQEVFHVHLHVFPRFSGDGFGLELPDGYRNRPERSELDEIAQRLRRVVDEQ